MCCSGRTAFSAARIFDGERILDDHAVLVENGVVSAVMPRGSLPEGIPVRQEPGCTIIPGLIDTHVHFMRWQGPLFLAQGVTTVRDVGNDLAWILARRREWSGHDWPRIFCMGPLLDGPAPIHRMVSRSCSDLEGAQAAVREMVAAGVDGIKLYVGLKAEWLPEMVRQGHAAGLRLSMHGARDGVLGPGRAGVDEFFHLDGILADIWPSRPPGWLSVWGLPELAQTWDRQREVADEIRRLGMTATPTLAYWDSQWRRALQAAQRFVGLLRERGVPILAGSDVPCGAVPPGLSLWREMALLVEAGLSPRQALRAATSEAASFMGQARLGWLRPGSAADLVVVRGNPVEHIPEKPEVVLVLRQGVAYRPADLLASAETATSTIPEEPWGIQLAMQRAGSSTPRPAPPA